MAKQVILLFICLCVGALSKPSFGTEDGKSPSTIPNAQGLLVVTTVSPDITIAQTDNPASATSLVVGGENGTTNSTTTSEPTTSVNVTTAKPTDPSTATTTTPTTTTVNPTTAANITQPPLPTTTAPTTTSTAPNTTVTSTTTVAPATTTSAVTTPGTTSVVTTPLPVPTAAPSKDRRFDGPSFIGGIVLSLGIMAIAFVAFKFYKARTERNYHTL